MTRKPTLRAARTKQHFAGNGIISTKKFVLRLTGFLALCYIGAKPAMAGTILFPVCNFPPCDDKLIFNFDFTNPSQSVSPPYVQIQIQIPVHQLGGNSASFTASVYSALDGQDDGGSTSSYIGGVQPNESIISLLFYPGAGFDGQLDGLFSIGLSSGGTLVPIVELTAPPFAQALAADCFNGGNICSSVTIAGIQSGSIPEPESFVLITAALSTLFLPRRRKTQQPVFMAEQ